MSADVNVCVYSTSNLLFRQVLLLQLRLIPKHGDNGNDALSVCMFLAWEWALTAACPSWTIQLTLLTDPPCCHTEAKSSKYIIKTPGEGDFPCQGTKQTNKKNPLMLLNTTVLHQTHIRHGCISLTLKVNTPCRSGTRCVWLALMIEWDTKCQNYSSNSMFQTLC